MTHMTCVAHHSRSNGGRKYARKVSEGGVPHSSTPNVARLIVNALRSLPQTAPASDPPTARLAVHFLASSSSCPSLRRDCA